MASHSLEPIRLFREFTDFSEDIDLVALSPAHDSAARYIRAVTGTGTVAVVMVDTGADPLTLAEGQYERGQFRKILASGTSGVSRVRVGW